MTPVLQYNLLDAIIHAPFSWLFGPLLGYNLSALFALFATGWSGYALARSAHISQLSACLVGTLIQTSSLVALELHCGRISQVTLVFFLLALRELLSILDDKSSKWASLRLGLLSAGTALVYWYFGFALLLSGVTLILFKGASDNRKYLRAVAIASLIGLAVSLPFIIELLSGWSSLPGVERTDSLGIVLANSRSALWPLFNTDPIHGHQLSLVTLALVFWAIKKRVSSWKPWAAIAAMGWILSLGPGPNALLPFGWLQALVPTFDRMWWPYRFEVLTVIGTAVIAGAGLDQWLKDRDKNMLWLIAAIALSTLDAPLRSGLLPIKASTVEATNHGLYKGIDQPILTVPVLPNQAESERLLLLQTIHKQPTQNGDGEHLTAHMPKAQQAWLASSHLVDALLELNKTGSVQQSIAPEDIQYLLDAGFRFVVVDASVFSGPGSAEQASAHSQFFEALWGRPMTIGLNSGGWRIEAIADPVVLDIQLPKKSDRVRRRGRK